MNLPTLKVGFFENLYQKFIGCTLSNIDDGSLFKSFITTVISLFAYVVLVTGVYDCIAGISDAFSGADGSGLDMVTGWLGILVGIALGVLVPWALYRVIKKRTEELAAEAYSGILDYFFKKTMPKIITIFGEMVFVSMVCLGLAVIVATLINSSVYISFAGAAADNTDQAMGLVAMLSDMAANAPFVDGIPGVDWAGALANVSGEAAGSWSNFIGDIEGGVMTIINAFMVVIYFYIVREVYNFAMTLITAFINFLPKLAIPLAIRNK